MGIRITDSALTFPPTTTHIPVVDAMESPGALMIIDPAHPAAPITGVLTNGQLLPDVAQASATALGITDLTPAAVVLGPAQARTAKGGLRVTPGATGGAAVILRLSDKRRQYMQANITHKYRMDWWLRVISGPTTTASNANGLMRWATAANSRNLGLVRWDGVTVQGSTRFNPAALTTPGLVRVTSEWVPEALAATDGALGSTNFALQISQLMGNAVDMILYRMALVDKTADGRTDAALNDAEQRAYDAAFGVGGRYAGDSW